MIKTSQIKRKISSHIIKILFNKKNRNNKYISNKVLIIATDALGDVIIKVKLYDLIIEKYGRENVVFMFNYKWSSTMEKLGYKIFHSKTKKEKYGLISRILLIKKINNEKFDKIINLDICVPELPIKYLISNKKIGFIEEGHENNFDKYINGEKYSLVLDKLRDMGELILGQKLSIEEIKPDLTTKISKKINLEGITIAVGASSKNRTISPIKMSDIITKLIKIFPREKIYLLGSGKKQQIYSKNIIKKINNKNIINLVDKINLYQVINQIHKSKFFIGPDSGLYNLSFALKKKTIGLFNHFSGFQHDDRNVQIIVCEMPINYKKQNNLINVKEYSTNHKGEKYGTFKLNNFNIKYIEIALKNLNLIEG